MSNAHGYRDPKTGKAALHDATPNEKPKPPAPRIVWEGASLLKKPGDKAA